MEKIITKVKINCILICILKILPSSIRHSLGRHCKEVALAALQAGTTTLHCKRKNLIASSSIYPPRSVRLRTCDRVGVCVSARHESRVSGHTCLGVISYRYLQFSDYIINILTSDSRCFFTCLSTVRCFCFCNLFTVSNSPRDVCCLPAYLQGCYA